MDEKCWVQTVVEEDRLKKHTGWDPTQSIHGRRHVVSWDPHVGTTLEVDRISPDTRGRHPTLGVSYSETSGVRTPLLSGPRHGYSQTTHCSFHHRDEVHLHGSGTSRFHSVIPCLCLIFQGLLGSVVPFATTYRVGLKSRGGRPTPTESHWCHRTPGH